MIPEEVGLATNLRSLMYASLCVQRFCTSTLKYIKSSAILKEKSFLNNDQNKGKIRRTDERDAKPQRALRNRWKMVGTISGFTYENTYPKIICNLGTHSPKYCQPSVSRVKKNILK